MKVVFAYFGYPANETRGLVLRDDVDLPLGAGCVRAYARSIPALAARTRMVNRSFTHEVPVEAAVEAIAAEAPDLVAFGCYVWNAGRTLEACRLLRRRLPAARLVLGGPEVPRRADEAAAYLHAQPALDYAVRGEGEGPFAGLLSALLEGRSAADVPGLAFREEGRVGAARDAAPLRDAARMVSPYLSGDVELKRSWVGLLPIETSRGCPYRCSYCDYHAARQRVTLFPLERLRAELDLLRERDFRGLLYIADPFVNLYKAHALEVFTLLSRYPFPCMFEFNAEAFDEATLTAYLGISDSWARVGVQSTNPAALRAVHRAFRPERAAPVLARLARKALTVELILGLPDDDYDGYKRSLDWCLSLKPVPEIHVFDLLLLRNTELHDSRRRLDLETDERGYVTANRTFSRQDLVRASQLNYVYNLLLSSPPSDKLFFAFLGHGIGRPTDFLEHLRERLAFEGRLPPGRLFEAQSRCLTPDRPVTPAQLKSDIAAFVRKVRAGHPSPPAPSR